jgi:hypothetical protein
VSPQVTRRRFVALLSALAANLRQLTGTIASAALAFLGTGCPKDSDNGGSQTGPYTSYQIEADIGDIYLKRPFASVFPGPIYANRTVRLAQLEFPAGLLLRLDLNSPIGPAERILLRDIEVRFNGSADPDAFAKNLIVPTGDGFTLEIPAQLFFPETVRPERPFAVRFGPDDYVTIHLHRQVSPGVGFITATATWPQFYLDLLVWNDLRSPKSTLKSLRGLQFAAPTISETVPMLSAAIHPGDLPPGLGLHVFKVRDSRQLFTTFPQGVTLFWRPGWLQLSAEGRTGFQLQSKDQRQPGTTHSAQVFCDTFAVINRDPSLITAETRLPLTNEFSAVAVNTDENFAAFIFENLSFQSDSWPGEIPEAHLLMGKADVQLKCTSRPGATNRCWARSFLFDDSKRRSFWQQEGFDVEMTFSGLGIGSFAGVSGISAVDCGYSVDDQGTARFLSPSASHRLVTENPKNWVRVGDYLVSVESLKDFSLNWKEAGDKASDASGGAVFCNPNLQLAWAGNAEIDNSEERVWMHLAPWIDQQATSNFRGVGANPSVALQWLFDRESHQLRPFIPQDPTTVTACTPTKPFDLEGSWVIPFLRSGFRASLRADQEFSDNECYYLPPFTLREHPANSADDTWTNSQIPRFRARNMFEPWTRAFPDESVSESKRSPGNSASVKTKLGVFERLKRFGTDCRRGLIEFATAGISMRGRYAKTAPWMPTAMGERFAPYTPISVEEVGVEAGDVCSSSATVAPSSVDLISISIGQTDLRDTVDLGLTGTPPQCHNSLKKAVSQPDVPIALSPIGGSILFDWSFGANAPNGLVALGLHSYLQRYDNNYAIQDHMLLPWGIRFQVVTRVFRDVDGNMAYCQAWSFIQDQQVYGPNNDIRIYNLRPLNSTTWRNPHPLDFLADFDVRGHDSVVAIPNKKLSGGFLGKDVAEERTFEQGVAFPELSGKPRTLFLDTVLDVQKVTWTCNTKKGDVSHDGDTCTTHRTSRSASATLYEITIAANGQIPAADVMAFDDRGVVNSSLQKIDADTAQWIDRPVSTTQYSATALTLGPGLARFANPLPASSTNVFVTASGDYTYVKKIGRDDLFLLDLMPGVFNANADPKGTLTLKYHYDSSVSPVPEFTGTIEYPDLTSLTTPVCEGTADLKLACQPKQLNARFGSKIQTDVRLVFDLGVKGIFVLKDSTATLGQDGRPHFGFGKFEPCPGLFELLFSDLIKKLSSSGGNSFQIFASLSSITFQIPIALPDVPLGAGTLINFQFHFRVAFRFDFTSSGSSRGLCTFFALGNPQFKGLEGLSVDWLSVGASLDDLAKFAFDVMAHIEPLSLTFTPFTVRFKSALIFRAIPIANSNLPKLQAITCFEAQGGLAFDFSLAVIKGGISIALALRWCPKLEIGATCSYFDPSLLAVGIVFDGHACVIEIINIKVHAEIMASLHLGCPQPKNTIEHVVFSGYASIDMFLVTIKVDFTVDCDSILGLQHCETPKPCTTVLLPEDRETFLADAVDAKLAQCFASLECAA